MEQTHFKSLIEEKKQRIAKIQDVRDLRALRTLQTELNVSRHAAFIFAPSHTRPSGKPDDRVRVKIFRGENPETGESFIRRLTVHTVDGYSTRTFDGRTWLALVKLWWERPKNPDGSTTYSLYELARLMKLGWGNKVHRALKDSLRRLRRVPFTWQNIFLPAGAKEAIALEDDFTILRSLRTVERHMVTAPEDANRKTVVIDSTKGTFAFHELIERNLGEHRTKPVLFDVYMDIRGEVAFSLYAHLDRVLFDKAEWERTATNLLTQDLYVAPSNLRYPSWRRKALEGAVRELSGKPLSTGTLTLGLEKTVDGSDWKLVARKTSFDELAAQVQGQPRRGRPPKLGRLDPHKQDLLDELVTYFNDEKSRGFYLKLVREESDERVRGWMRETDYAYRMGDVKTTKAKYFTDLVKRFRTPRESSLS
jgi:hypothetical protein